MHVQSFTYNADLEALAGRLLDLRGSIAFGTHRSTEAVLDAYAELAVLESANRAALAAVNVREALDALSRRANYSTEELLDLHAEHARLRSIVREAVRRPALVVAA